MDVKLNQAKNEITIVLAYDAAASAPLSSTGKSMKRASTGGNIPTSLDGKVVMIGVNVFQKVTG